MKLYAVSYDDAPALREFAEKQSIPYPLLSDLGSRVIRAYGIENEQVGSDDAFLQGIPYPGAFVCDADGVVIAKSFHDTYKKRDSPEILLDAARGRIELVEDAPRAVSETPEVRVTAALHGGKGTIRQGIVRQLVVRFELGEGLHLYGRPVPEGMIPTTVTPRGPEGLVFGEARYPPTTPFTLPGIDTELPVWSGNFDVVIPVYADGRLASETRPLDRDAIEIEVDLRYQACDDAACLLPRNETLTVTAALDVVDVPKLGMHTGHGQREGNYDATPHMRRMIGRAARRSPLGFVRFLLKNLKLERAARKRRRDARRSTR